jgi:hypothetical protein
MRSSKESAFSSVGVGFSRTLVFVLVLSLWGGLGLAQENGSGTTQHFKMLSTVEFDGQGQFRNQVETLFTVERKPLEEDKVHYSVYTGDFSLIDGQAKDDQASTAGALSFVVNRATKRVSVDSQEFSFFEQINNECVDSLKKVTKENVGKSWKQTFSLPFLDDPFPQSIRFKMKAIQVETDLIGEMIAIRAISEPFRYEAQKPGTEDEMETIQSRIGTVYLFDPAVETIYMSISVFEAKTKISGQWEVLRHEVATYMTNESGESLDLSGLGKSFESLVKGVKMKGEGLEVVDSVELPLWAQSEALKASQVANICASLACEGAPNPVMPVSLPVSQTLGLQSGGRLSSLRNGLPLFGSLGAGVPGVGNLNFIGAAPFLGIGAGNAALGAGAIAGGAALINNASD